MRRFIVKDKIGRIRTKGVVLATILSLFGVFLFSNNVSAGMEVNSRLYGGDVYNYCTNGGTIAYASTKGMVWLSNDGDYYSENVYVSETAQAASVQVRGAANSCGFTWNSPANIYAAEVSTSSSRLAINGNNFFRGYLPAGSNQWTGQGSSLSATLNVQDLAQCTGTGRVNQDIYVDVYRRLQYEQNGTFVSLAPGTETVLVRVSRDCPAAAQWTINGQSYIKNSPSTAMTGQVGGTITAAPGNRLNWYHDLRNNGPQNMDKSIAYQVNKTGFSNGWNGNTDPRGNAQGGVNALFLQVYANLGSPYTIYDVTQADVGNTLCQRIAWQPGAWNNSSQLQSNPACATVPYNYTLTPAITNVADNSTTDPDRTEVNIAGTVTNNGPTKSRTNVQWQLTQIVYPAAATLPTIPNRAGGTSPSNPCTYLTGEQTCTRLDFGTEAAGYAYPGGGSYSKPADIGSLAVGQRVCFMLSVQPHSGANNDWRHSSLRCMIVSKSPKVNILGGDLYTGRTLPGVTAPTGSKVTTSVSNTSVGTFGSWAEYAIVPTGTVTNMASGSGYVGGVAETSVICGISLLTFTNVTGPSPAGCNAARVGNFTSTSSMPNVASRFKVTAATPRVSGQVTLASTAAGVYTSNATSFNVQGGSALPANKWVVINAPDATVTINNNIQYSDGPFTAASQIPQVIIIANNINIAENVTNVDAWLISNGKVSGSTITGGVINTCSRVGTITSRNCNLKLTVNGPVIANRLYMLRTAGAGPAAQSIEPAEVFNLRADAYLWAMSRGLADGRVTTTSTTELPPRY